jgi:hypothetical protein
MRIFAVLPLLLMFCASGKFVVSDENFFTDGYVLGKGYLQFVEAADNTSVSEPAAERFRKNCAEAETKAKTRFTAAHPQAKDQGRRLGEYFEKNGSCRVRMAFKVD